MYQHTEKNPGVTGKDTGVSITKGRMDKKTIDCLQTGNEADGVGAALGCVHHLNRTSPIANQVVIDVLVMSNRDRNALAAKRN